ncbi:GEVED domain-containing protein [Flavobacterium ardleyense]|uniref:GEVED domain-containing protein n=1 Tax=Flavobacterium ardleyense TaxID=2038737 RepID=UPI00298D1A49|nr:GEVED domain-containing protein [Flavobacterium ardleyense]
MLFLSQEINAQANTYIFAQSNGTYTPITGGIVVVTSVNNVPSIDTYASSVLTIPSFTFAGTAYTQMSVTSNGQLALGGSTPSHNTYDVLSATTGGNVFLAPFSADLNSNTTSTGEIRYEIIGNDIIVQWTNFQRYGITENINFQVRMNRSTGVIKFVYDGTPPYGSSTSHQPQVGIKSAVGNYSALTVASAGSWNSPVKITTGIGTNSICTFTLNTGPTSGLTYTWSPDVPAVPNCATSFIPVNSATNVVTSPTLTWASGGGVPTSYNVYFGTNANPPLIGNQTGISYNPGTLAANTTYYWQIVPKNSIGSAAGCTVNSFKTTAASLYCTAGATNTSFEKIHNVTIGGINNNSTSTAGYEDFTSVSTTLFQGQQYAFSASGNTSYAVDQVLVWIDFNQNGSFTDGGEQVFVSSTQFSPWAGSLTIPASALLGATRMRVRLHDTYNNPNSTPCGLSGYGQVEDYTVIISTLTPCTGTPIAGSVTVNPTLGSPGSVYSVGASGFTPASGLTFQWQYSDNGGGTWTNQGAATPSYSSLTGMTAPAFGIVRTWRLLVTCSASGLTATSSTGKFTSSYCVPSGTTAYYITNFKTTGGATDINNSSGNSNIYGNYAAISASQYAGSSLNLSISTNSGQHYFSGWVDWNNDGDFADAGEAIFSTSTFTNSYSGAYTIAASQPAGSYRMRIANSWSATSITSCSGNGYSEYEDYTITVLALTPCTGTPTAGAVTVNPVSGQPGSSYAVTASGFTGASGLTYQWQYSDNGGGTWTNQGGSTPSYSNLTGMIAPAFGIVRTWRLTVTCTSSGAFANSSTGTFTSSYCSTFSTSSEYYIKNFATTGGIGNITNLNTSQSPNGYGNYTSQSVSQYAGSSINFTTSFGLNSTYTFGFSIWIDWNNDGDFLDSGEQVYVSSSYNTNYSSSFSIPMAVVPGNYRMRVLADYYSIAPMNPCALSATGPYGEVEDYTLQVLSLGPCTTPAAQPTALSLTVSGAVINGSFIAATPAPNSYLVVVGTNATPPTLVNGTTYPIGSSIGAGYTVVDNDSNTSFSANSLNSLTTYYFFVYSMNNFCTGGPNYQNTSPLTGSAITGSCVPSVSSGYQNSIYTTRVDFSGTLNDTFKTSTFSNSPLGYQDWTSLPDRPIQVPGEYINVSVQNNTASNIVAWVDWDKDGNFVETEKVYSTNGNSRSAASFNFLIPIGQTLGDYKIRIRSNTSTGTFPYTSCQLLTSQAGETEDYLFTVVAKCNSLVISVTNGLGCDSSTVTLGATATAGVTQFRWYTAQTGGTSIGTSTVGAGFSTTFTTPVISTTTNYYVAAWNGTCETQMRTLVTAKMSKAPIVTFTPAAPKICGDTEIVQLSAAGSKEFVYLINEDFESGGLGLFTNENIINNTPTINSTSSWQNRSSTFISTLPLWRPSISSGSGANKFVTATSDVGSTTTVHNALRSPIIDTRSFATLHLKFDMYYSRYYANGTNTSQDFVAIEGSRDGGVTWLTAEQLKITDDEGKASKFNSKTIELSFLTGEENARFRIIYYGTSCEGVAIDNIEFYGKKTISEFNFDTTAANAFMDAAATIPYMGTPTTSIYIKPSLSQLENALLNIAVYTGSDACATGINIVNNTKSFSAGTSPNDWNAATNWKPAGVPTATNCIIILDDDVRVTGTNYSASGLNLAIKNNALLTVNAGNTIIITDKVIIESTGELRLKDGASLLQINDIQNTGTGQMKVERIANIRKTDYVYWSSPVTTASAFSSASISPETYSNMIYKWLPTIPTNLNGFGNWTAGIESMISGKGYIVRGPNSFSETPAPFTTTFAGTPSNGTISIPIQRGDWNGGVYSTGVSPTPGTNNDDNWNLVGNPYPSAIDAKAFLLANTNIDGFINIWTHGTMPNSTIPNPFYGTFSYNYNLSDYITYNSSGTQNGPTAFNGYIPSGQGFFVAMLHGSTNPGNITFTNALRGSTYNNSVFYKSAADQNSAGEGRIWLDIVADDGRNVRTLVAYVEGATNGRDRLFDAITDDKEDLNLFSNIEDDMMKIQGKVAPFVQHDKIPLGIKVPRVGLYSIAIAAVDGLFTDASQNIYLEDMYHNVIHNLRENPYKFNSQGGKFTDRFVLRYTNGTLGNENHSIDPDSVLIACSEQIEVKSVFSEIDKIRIFDVLGKELANFSNVNDFYLAISRVKKENKALIVRVSLINGFVVNKMIIY